MTLGDGIFWSSVLVISALLMRSITVHRKWWTVAKGLGALIVCALVVAGAYFGKSLYDNRARSINGLWGIQFGATPLDVQLLKGAPTDKSTPDKLPTGEIRETWLWYHGDEKSGLPEHTVVFFAGKASIICSTESRDYLFGLLPNATESAIRAKLGTPNTTSIRLDGLGKAISYSQLQVGFELERGSVRQVCATRGGKLTYRNEYGSADSKPKNQ